MLKLLNAAARSIRRRLFLFKHRNIITAKGKISLEKRIEIRNFNNSKNDGLSISLEENITIRHDVTIQGKGELHIGRNTIISSFTIIGCNEKMSIGKDCLISQSVSIRDTDHNFDDINIPTIDQGINTSPITINDNVWIGYGAVITKGITIGEGSIVGANSVVTKNVEPYSIVAGVPAVLIRSRK